MTAPTEEQLAVWNEWVAARPERVRAVAERFEPWNEYQFKETKRVCALYSFEEGEKITLKVIAPQLFGMTHLVFGVDPDDLEPRDEHCVDPRDMFPKENL